MIISVDTHNTGVGLYRCRVTQVLLYKENIYHVVPRPITYSLLNPTDL